VEEECMIKKEVDPISKLLENSFAYYPEEINKDEE